MNYAEYLDLDRLLAAQHPRSEIHDEMLFIVQHQTTELWMKLILHELHAARRNIQHNQLSPALKMSARVSRIMDQMVQAWTVLSTLTPAEYGLFRDQLGSSSGFQSAQYRMIEFLCGNKNARMLQPHAYDPALHVQLTDALAQPSLYDVTLQLLAKRGLRIPATHLNRDFTQPYVADDSVEHAWHEVYRRPEQHWDLYEWAEELVDFEDSFRQWRFRHVTTVERIIGFKTGTGGTSGVNYLRKMLDVVLFPELWRVRSSL
jgi:tryptophan 2,3-dioxygenase